MKLQRYHADNWRRYKEDMPPEVEEFNIECIGMAYDVQEVDREIARLEAENKRLREENQKLRALVERGGKLDVFNPQKGGLLKFAEDCREALK